MPLIRRKNANNIRICLCQPLNSNGQFRRIKWRYEVCGYRRYPHKSPIPPQHTYKRAKFLWVPDIWVGQWHSRAILIINFNTINYLLIYWLIEGGIHSYANYWII